VPAPFGPASNGLIPYVSAGDIYVGDPTTGKTRLLVGGPDDDASPGYSPDGTRLAFIRDVGRAVDTIAAPVHLFVVREDGTGQTRVTTTPIQTLVWASWTPDGRQLAVVQPFDDVNQLDLFDTDGPKAPHRIAAAAGIDSLTFHPPDGRQILFRALVGGRYGLFVMDADGTDREPLIAPTETEDIDQELNGATYSADGSRIFYQRWTPDSIQLWVMNADGTDRHEFFPEPGQGWDGLATPSPGGRWIAYWHVIEDGRPTQRLSVVRADGTGPIIETGPELTGNARWTWAPDSSKILMIPDDGGPGSAYLLDPTGGAWTNVAWTSDIDLDWQRIAP
jgi:Tol biopolymer transport system component